MMMKIFFLFAVIFWKNKAGKFILLPIAIIYIDKVSGILPDVILMDNWIPDDGGIIATQTLKKIEELKNIPVIYFSANSDINCWPAMPAPKPTWPNHLTWKNWSGLLITY